MQVFVSVYMCARMFVLRCEYVCHITYPSIFTFYH